MDPCLLMTAHLQVTNHFQDTNHFQVTDHFQVMEAIGERLLFPRSNGGFTPEQDHDKTTTRQMLNLCIPMIPFTPGLSDLVWKAS